MGKKMSAEEIETFAKENPNTGFDTCYLCDGVEPQGSMEHANTITESDSLICDECDSKNELEVRNAINDEIDEIFTLSHQLYKTKSGDITPTQVEELNELKEQLVSLVLIQTMQNL